MTSETPAPTPAPTARADLFPCPWPEWMGIPEPGWIKHMPGGCVTIGTFAIILFACIGLTFVKLIKSYCFKPSVSVRHREAAGQVKEKMHSKETDPFKDCVGPKLVVVLREQREAKCGSCTPLLCPVSMVRRELLESLSNSKTLVAVPLDFDEGSALADKEVWVLGIKHQELGTCAEVFGMLKLVDTETIKKKWKVWQRKSVASPTNARVPPCLSMAERSHFQEDLFDQEIKRLEDRLHDPSKMFNTWRPYSERKKSMFLPASFYTKPDEDESRSGCCPWSHKRQFKSSKSDLFDPSDISDWSSIWTMNDVVTIMLGIIGRERSPGKHGKDNGGYPIFLAAVEVGEIETIFPFVDEPEDRKEIMKTLKDWKTRKFWKKPPLEDIMKIFGPSTAIYFSYMQTYATWILYPAIFAVLSFIWHVNDLQWGAAFTEGWSQALSILFLSGWSSIFFCAWTRQCAVLNFRLGQDVSAGDTYGIDGATLYFRNRGYKVKRKASVDIKTKKGFMGLGAFSPTRRNPLVRSVLMIMTLMLFLGFTIFTIACLCWVSDKASEINYFNIAVNHTDSVNHTHPSSTVFDGGVSYWKENENFIMQNLISVACYFVISIPLEGVYIRMTFFLTELENLRNRSAFVERVVRRRALFQLINSQGWFMYLAFGRRDMRMLRWQLTVFFLLKPSGLLGTFVELLFHFWGKIYKVCKNRCKKPPEDDYHKEELHHNILNEYSKEEPNLFDEYLEVTILFSAVLCFAPVFPEGMLVAFLHTVCEYFTDKNKLFVHLRLGLPKRSDLFAIKGWITVWQGLGWIGIVASTWLTHIFLSDPQINHDHTDDWVPEKTWQDRLGLTTDDWGGDIAWVRIVIVEHFLLAFKAYLAVAVQVESDDIVQHKEVVDRIFAEDAEPDTSHSGLLESVAQIGKGDAEEAGVTETNEILE